MGLKQLGDEMDGYKIRRRAKLTENAKGEIKLEVTVEMIDGGPMDIPGVVMLPTDQRIKFAEELESTWNKAEQARDAVQK